MLENILLAVFVAITAFVIAANLASRNKKSKKKKKR